MTDEIDLLPLPEDYDDTEGLWEKCYGPYSLEQMEDYARANVARAVEPLQAEIEALREALVALKAENEMLREALKDADNELDLIDEEMDTCDHSVGVCTCSYWSMRRKMKAALAREASND